LAPTTLALVFLTFSFILAAVVHPQEFWCLPYGIIYYVTIPSMYLLLVIYSFFNMNDVSWGTREVAKKKTKAELIEEREKEKQMKEQATKINKKNEGGLVGFLMQKSGVSEKGGLEFSLANLFKCMCFTHEEEEGPKKQLVKISAAMDEVNIRLGRMEGE
jgi:chitin synthase